MQKLVIKLLILLAVTLMSSCTEDKSDPAIQNKPKGGEPESYRVIAKPALTVRYFPDVGAPTLHTVGYGEQVRVIDTKGRRQTINGLTGHWYKIESKGLTGWAFGPLLVYFSQSALPVQLVDGGFVRQISEPHAVPNLGETEFQFDSSEGPYLINCKYQFLVAEGLVEEECCYYWPGPPDRGDKACKVKHKKYEANNSSLQIVADEYNWNARLNAFVPSRSDIKIIYKQALNGEVDPADSDQAWQYDHQGCRFCQGHKSCYGGQIVLLCPDKDSRSPL